MGQVGCPLSERSIPELVFWEGWYPWEYGVYAISTVFEWDFLGGIGLFREGCYLSIRSLVFLYLEGIKLNLISGVYH